MMALETRTVGFNQELVKFMRDNPGTYISIKGNRGAQLMFEEGINDEMQDTTLVATLVARRGEVQLSKEA